MNNAQAYGEYLKTEYWSVVSYEVKRRAGFRCQVCNSANQLQAHHRTYEHRGIELEHLNDLTCLCAKCHDLFHGNRRLQESPENREARIRLNRIRRLVNQMGMDEKELSKKTDKELFMLNRERKAMNAAKKYGLT